MPMEAAWGNVCVKNPVNITRSLLPAACEVFSMLRSKQLVAYDWDFLRVSYYEPYSLVIFA